MVIDVIALTRAFSAEAAVLLIEPRAQSGGHCHPVKIRQQKTWSTAAFSLETCKVLKEMMIIHEGTIISLSKPLFLGVVVP